MIDFSLTEEQRALRDLMRSFVQREVKPIAAELDARQDPVECFPWTAYERAQEHGLRTMTLAKEYGGAGIDGLTAAILIEEACACDAGFGIGIQQLWMVSQMIQTVGSKAQCDRFLPQFRDDPHYFLAAAACEPEAGTDVFLPHPDPRAGIKLTAGIQGNEVVFDGIKHMIAFGNVAKLLMVYARTDKTKPMTEGTTLFLVPSNAPGFKVGRVFNPMGWRLFPTAELFFEQCRVPKENQVGKWNNAYGAAAQTIAVCTAWAGAVAVGMARAAFEKAVAYAKTRVQGTVPIIQHNNTAMQLAEMFVKIEAARYLTWKTCWNALHEGYLDLRLVRAPKIFGSQVARDVSISAMELHGGSGVMREVGMEKIVRDALTLLHVFGPNDISLIQVGRIIAQGLGPAKE